MKIKNLTKFIEIFLVYFLSDLIPLIILGENYFKLNITTKLQYSIICNLLVTMILFFWYKDYLKEKLKDFKKNFSKYMKIGFKYWLIGLSIMYIGNLLLYTFSPAKEAINENNVQNLISASPLLALILTTIFAPINEEIIFRKAIQDIFHNKYIFIIVSALIFGGLHVTEAKTLFDFLYIIPYSALGGAFAYILAKTDNIYVPISMHLIHNGILTLISILI